MLIVMQQPAPEPGESLARVLAVMPEPDRKPFLAWLEQRVRREGNLAELREIRAYKVKNNL